MSRDYCVALPHDARVCLKFVFMVFPDHTHLLFSSPGFKFQSFLQKYISLFIISDKNSLENFGGLKHARRSALESDILSLETLLHKFTPTATVSQTVRTICSVVTENSSGQNLGENKKELTEQKQYVSSHRIKVSNGAKIRN